MMRRVVDTNLPVVANGRNTNASIDCRLAAIDFLDALLKRGRTILDYGGQIQAEYRRHLHPSGQPGVGDRFYQVLLTSGPARVERIDLPTDPATGEFVDFPSDPALTSFDRSDRKFAAAARKSGAPVASAVDRGWLLHEVALSANGVAVEFVCGRNPSDWFADT
jgi:hypothetical protein